ncbi:MAG: phosphatidate cytidylyltransferase [Clostridia bacterium]|nr:phosphatidate cytidylyltransferase [Clostridia bacterium]
MKTRILTALIGVVVFFILLFSPVYVYHGAIFAVMALMLFEMYGVLKAGALANAAGALSAAVVFVTVAFFDKMLAPTLVCVAMLYMLTVVFTHGKKNMQDILSHAFITLYISVFMSFLSKIGGEFTAMGALWAFIIAWICDSGAYFAGVFLGKHKLVPNISPKKTVEGAVGGIVAVLIATVVYYLIYKNGAFDILDLSKYLAMTFVASILSQFGDLIASCVKRDKEVKDYGSILPGHGGFMDRFDSVVFISPLVYYSLTLIGA